MFTGLIEEVSSVKTVRNVSDGRIIEIESRIVIDGSRTGDSIAVNGACQTVTEIGNTSFSVFASRVTCSLTTLGNLKSGDPVNLERALTPTTRMGGHIVQGHVDGTGRVRSISRDANGVEIDIETDSSLLKYIVSKGSVAVDGISLTVVSMNDSGFSLYLIPETLEKTIIRTWSPGSRVNLETDILAKYVERMLTAGNDDKGSGDEALMGKLMEGGFI